MTLTLIRILELDAETWSTPALASDRIVAADRSGRVRAWDASGAVVWEYASGAEITASPTLAELDGTRAILIGDHAGTFVALDLASGEELWRQAFGAMIRATAAVADIDGETAILLPVYGPRLVRLDARGRVQLDRALPKNEVYQRGKAAGAVSTPLVADIDGDDRLEVVFGVRAQRVYCCDAETGEIRWFRPLAYDPDSSPTLSLSPEGKAQILVGGGEHTAGAGDNALIALAPSDGRILWRAPAGGGVDGAATVADLGAGEGAVFCSLGSASAIAIGLSGRELWRTPFGPTDACVHDPICRDPKEPYFTGRARCRSYTTPLVADLDGDGAPEVVVGSNNGTTLVLDAASGAVKARGVGHGMVRGSAVLGDVDGDGQCEMVVPSGESLMVYETAAPPEAAWPQTKGEPTHLGWRSPRPVPPVRGPAPRRVRSRLAWHSTGRDALRFAAFQVERRLLNPLGIRIARYYY
ncbi:MAG: PQQ-binding-like beta-propeller repeat protein [Bacteroidota bacterium]